MEVGAETVVGVESAGDMPGRKMGGGTGVVFGGKGIKNKLKSSTKRRSRRDEMVYIHLNRKGVSCVRRGAQPREGGRSVSHRCEIVVVVVSGR